MDMNSKGREKALPTEADTSLITRYTNYFLRGYEQRILDFDIDF